MSALDANVSQVHGGGECQMLSPIHRSKRDRCYKRIGSSMLFCNSTVASEGPGR